MNFPGYSTRIGELNWYGGGGCIRKTFNPTFSELCIIAFHYDDPLSLVDLLPPLLLPLLSPCVWYYSTMEGVGSIEWRLISQMFTIIVPWGLYRLTKGNRKKRNKKKEKQETADVPVYLILTFDLRMAQLLVLRKKKNSARSQAVLPLDVRRRRRKKLRLPIPWLAFIERCSAFSIHPITIDLMSMQPLVKRVSYYASRRYCSLNIHLERWDDIYRKEADESVSRLALGWVGIYFTDWCQFRH